jgi:hypothetical protein
MAKIKRISLPWTTVWTRSGSVVRLPATPWMSAADIARVRGTFELQARDADLEVAIGYEVADVENAPVAGTAGVSSGPAITAYHGGAAGNGMKYPSDWWDLGADTKTKQLFRLVWLVRNNPGGSTLNLGRVGGVVDIEEC